MNVLVLGSGTSSGVPTIGCPCAVCHSADRRDNRLRRPILIEHESKNIVIDTTPDFRTQVLREGVQHVDALLFTHDHADHIMGFDDIRPFNVIQRTRIPAYGSTQTIDSLRRIFPYVFDNVHRTTFVPEIETHDHHGQPFELFGLKVQPVPLYHGRQLIYGYRISSLAYLTDHSEIPEESIAMLRGLDVLFVDALRYKPHPRIPRWELALKNIRAPGTQTRPSSPTSATIFRTPATEATLPENIRLAYDGFADRVGALSLLVYWNLEDVPADFGPSALTIGNFDGVHHGHRVLMRRAADIARGNGWKPSVLTFRPHPANVVAPARAPKMITSFDRRTELMAEEGIEQVLVLPFNPSVAAWSPEQFVKDLLVERLGVRAVVVGDDFRFGHKQAGNSRMLEEFGAQFGFQEVLVPQISVRGPRASSSLVRKLISAGLVARAARLLSRPFALQGRVVAGQGIGSRQTVPTLNLEPDSEVLPLNGVYATLTHDRENSRNWESITNVGYRPTFGGESLTVETFLLSPFEPPTPGTDRLSKFSVAPSR